MFLSYVGIRVTDLDRSVKFYSEVFGLKVVRSGDLSDKGGGKYVLLRDNISGQRLELNWYPEGSKYATKYEPGEGLDHLGVKVDDVSAKLKELEAKGFEVVAIPDSLSEQSFGNALTTHSGFAKDPDGNWIGLYDHSKRAETYDPDSY